MLIHQKDLEKYLVDEGDNRIFIALEFTSKAYNFIKDIEETFFHPIDKHRNDFNIIILNPVMGNIDCNTTGMKSEEDGTLSTSVFRITELLPPFPKVIVDVKKTSDNIKRLKYMVNKHNLRDSINIPEHYKK